MKNGRVQQESMVICAYGKSISRFTIVQYGTLEVYPAWQLVEELIAYAKSCCVLRELTPEERAQFGSQCKLPDIPSF